MTDPSVLLVQEFYGRRALVLGGSGFIGGTLARRLVTLGAHVTLTATGPATAHWAADLAGRAQVEIADLRDRARLKALVPGQGFIFNFAGLSGAVRSNARPVTDLEVNGRGVLNLLEACREHNPSARIIFPGSRLQYGSPAYLPVDEAHPMRPTSVYGAHKLLGEVYHHLYHHNHGLRTTVLRLSNPYGYSRPPAERAGYNVVSRFIHAALADEVLRVFGDGQQQRDYIHVDDVVEAVLRTALTEAMVGQAYNVGAGRPVPLIEMARLIVSTVGRGRLEQTPWPEQYKLVETGDFYFSIARLTQALNWGPRIELAEGVRRSLGVNP
jgi:UDP-glucose 4-epimerase